MGGGGEGGGVDGGTEGNGEGGGAMGNGGSNGGGGEGGGAGGGLGGGGEGAARRVTTEEGEPTFSLTVRLRADIHDWICATLLLFTVFTTALAAAASLAITRTIKMTGLCSERRAGWSRRLLPTETVRSSALGNCESNADRTSSGEIESMPPDVGVTRRSNVTTDL